MQNLLTAMNAVMQRVGYVQKSGKNTFHNYKYAGEADLLEVLRPALVENGLVLIPSLDGEPRLDEHGNTHLVMAYTLAHVSGEVWPEKIRVPGCGNDRSSKGTIGDKGPYKAMTGANKYALFKLFQIETGDDPEKDSPHDKATTAKADPVPAGVKRLTQQGGAGPQPGGITPEQGKQIGDLIASMGWTNAGAVGWLTKHFGVKTRAELTSEQAAEAIQDLKTRIAVKDAEQAEGVA